MLSLLQWNLEYHFVVMWLLNLYIISVLIWLCSHTTEKYCNSGEFLWTLSLKCIAMKRTENMRYVGMFEHYLFRVWPLPMHTLSYRSVASLWNNLNHSSGRFPWPVTLHVVRGWFVCAIKVDVDAASIGSGPHGHSFIIKTFFVPIKCYHCTSLMIGIERQGTFCEGTLFC